MYYFSTPLPFNKDKIDELAKISNSFKKSKIKVLYNSLPSDIDDFCGFEQDRCHMKHDMKTIEDFAKLVEYSQSLGFDFIYLINSPLFFSIDNRNKLEKQFLKLDKIVKTLTKYNVNKYRIANPQLIEHFKIYYPELNVSVSTTYGISSIKIVENLLKTYSNIKEIVPAYEQNRNFTLLKNLTKKFPQLKTELMVNENCILGCPFRILASVNSPPKIYEGNYDLKEKYTDIYDKTCFNLKENNYWLYVCQSPVIYPWQLKEYEKIGINNFKIVGRNFSNKKSYNNFIKSYLMALEDENNTDTPYYSLPINSKILVKDIKKYLPDIKYFVKYGALCSSRCGVECFYCFKCADKILKKFGRKNSTNISC